MELSLSSNSREYFIEDRIETGLLSEGWISAKSLTNIELGKNFPSYTSLKLLSTALEVDFLILLEAVGPYMPDSLNEIWVLLKKMNFEGL
ncbi:XRE family transcriptional regulator [Levilactobacillus brevis]|nr:XRE family transcriptional regulator [Levilactobacillus brevis]